MESTIGKGAVKHLAFQLGGAEFRLKILRIFEVVGLQEVMAVPRKPVHLKGVVNLRGRLVPVVDLRLRFGLPEQEDLRWTRVIVVQAPREAGPPGEPLLVGVVVEGVAEVLDPDGDDEKAAPHLPDAAGPNGPVKVLLEIDQMLAGQDLDGLERLANAVRER